MIGLNKTAHGILAHEKEIPVMDFYDVVVIGGGVAGVAAGMAAGKRGMKTIILETFTALGGLTTLGLVNIPLDFVSGLGKEMFKELEKVNGLWHRNTDPEKHKLVLDRMIKKYNVDVLFQAQVIDSIVEGDAIVGVVIAATIMIIPFGAIVSGVLPCIVHLICITVGVIAALLLDEFNKGVMAKEK